MRLSGLRKSDQGPGVWLSRDALERLRRYVEGNTRLAGARGLYLALAEISSDLESETFVVTAADIEARSGLSEWRQSGARRILKDLGLISVDVVRPHRGAKVAKYGTRYQLLGCPYFKMKQES